jgi:cytochrome b pre-mRNA-processing protein 3
MVLSFLRRGRHERAGFELYGAAVAAARDPYLYTALAVPDTLDGRFDLVGLHVFLVIRALNRLSPPASDLAQAVFDAMFSDMDINLREMGVGDMSVPKRVKAMWEAFHGRSAAYEAALAADDPVLLAAALTRNVWRGAATAEGHAATLARIARAQNSYLATQDAAVLAAGHAAFLAAEAAAA